jgi:hypothetical protein
MTFFLGRQAAEDVEVLDENELNEKETITQTGDLLIKWRCGNLPSDTQHSCTQHNKTQHKGLFATLIINDN